MWGDSQLFGKAETFDLNNKKWKMVEKKSSG